MFDGTTECWKVPEENLIYSLYVDIAYLSKHIANSVTVTTAYLTLRYLRYILCFSQIA